MISDKLETIKVYKTRRFIVEVASFVEYTDPAEKVPDPAYVRRIARGNVPWYCLGIIVRTRNDEARWMEREIGSAYLGCVDTLDWRDVGGREVAAEAIKGAREFAAALCATGIAR